MGKKKKYENPVKFDQLFTILEQFMYIELEEEKRNGDDDLSYVNSKDLFSEYIREKLLPSYEDLYWKKNMPALAYEKEYAQELIQLVEECAGWHAENWRPLYLIPSPTQYYLRKHVKEWREYEQFVKEANEEELFKKVFAICCAGQFDLDDFDEDPKREKKYIRKILDEGLIYSGLDAYKEMMRKGGGQLELVYAHFKKRKNEIKQMERKFSNLKYLKKWDKGIVKTDLARKVVLLLDELWWQQMNSYESMEEFPRLRKGVRVPYLNKNRRYLLVKPDRDNIMAKMGIKEFTYHKYLNAAVQAGALIPLKKAGPREPKVYIIGWFLFRPEEKHPRNRMGKSQTILKESKEAKERWVKTFI